jgi:hypothetical protein
MQRSATRRFHFVAGEGRVVLTKTATAVRDEVVGGISGAAIVLAIAAASIYLGLSTGHIPTQVVGAALAGLALLTVSGAVRRARSERRRETFIVDQMNGSFLHNGRDVCPTPAIQAVEAIRKHGHLKLSIIFRASRGLKHYTIDDNGDFATFHIGAGLAQHLGFRLVEDELRSGLLHYALWA